ncbi:hypothetical protein AVEN_122269-1 [Araneus ventricosus]|uniref:Uncharacterized protein n=1 Tax=Araneus ventricosus TaxID=182803 RepID=A0A4Y2VZ70_ARAVE|nr:hypothetical protein AVEN_122269-1 [Araneus ventricosus]
MDLLLIIKKSDMEIVKKSKPPDLDVKKEIVGASYSIEDGDENLDEQNGRNLRDRSILFMPVEFDNFVPFEVDLTFPGTGSSNGISCAEKPRICTENKCLKEPLVNWLVGWLVGWVGF